MSKGRFLIIKGADFSQCSVSQITPSANTIKITCVASPLEGGSVSGGGMYEENANVQLNAVASNLYQFSKWSDGNTNASRTVVAGTSDATYTAIFSEKTKIELTVADLSATRNIYKNEAPATSSNTRYVTSMLDVNSGDTFDYELYGTWGGTTTPINTIIEFDEDESLVSCTNIPQGLRKGSYTVPEGVHKIKVYAYRIDDDTFSFIQTGFGE